MVTINLLDVLLWTLRRSEKDVITLYRTLSPAMQLATGGSMLNFGLWHEHDNPIHAQTNLCSHFGDMAELDKAKNALDIGSGLSAPAMFWRDKYSDLGLYCVNINYGQLAYAGAQRNISFLNSSSSKLPFASNSVERVIALESAQHFKPLDRFILESKRVLKESGLLVLAMPITMGNVSLFKLGLLKFTWSSEHYSLEDVKKIIQSNGFVISKEELIGSDVYEPLAEYYVQNREKLRQSILNEYPNYVESILYKSILKMKELSEEKSIDYVLLKCNISDFKDSN